MSTGSPQAVAQPTFYADPVRKVGSQSELPGMTLLNGEVSVSGYQKFKIANRRVDRSDLGRKYTALSRFFHENKALTGPNSSLLDIGCNAGLMCFLAKEAGFGKVTGLDHDPEYISVLNATSITSGLQVNGIVGGWRAATGTYDVVTALALIHWIYSMTASEGSFENIFTYLYSITNKYLLLEWVAPNDPAIGALKHTSANVEVQKEPYELERFLLAGQRFFGTIDARIDSTPTRCIYVFRKEPRVSGFSSVVNITDTAVVKAFREEFVRFHGACVERERKALSALEGVEGVPLLLARTEGELILTNCGEPLTTKNLPPDAEQQGRDLVGRLLKRGVSHNDIHPGNLLVKDGRLHLIDFAWATFGNESKAFLPPVLGVDYGVRTKDEPYDDSLMMERAIRILRNATQ